jgi:hypothetical protein
MNVRSLVLFVAAATAGLWLIASPAQATRPVGGVVAGRVTALPGDYQIVLDGHVYRVRPGSPAAGALGKLAPGTSVEALMDGPPGDSNSRIILVNPRAGH